MSALALGTETVLLTAEIGYWTATSTAVAGVAATKAGAELATTALLQTAVATSTAVSVFLGAFVYVFSTIAKWVSLGVKLYTYWQFAGLRWILQRTVGVDLAEIYALAVEVTGAIMLVALLVGWAVGPWTWTVNQNETLQVIDQMHCRTVPLVKVFGDSWNDALDFYESLQPELNIFTDILVDFLSVLFTQVQLFFFDLVDILISMLTDSDSVIGCAGALLNPASVKQPLCATSTCVIRRLFCWAERVYQFVLKDVFVPLIRPIAGVQVTDIIVYFVEGLRNTFILLYHAAMIVLRPSIDAGCTDRATLNILRDAYPTAYNNFVNPSRCLKTRGFSNLRFWIMLSIGNNYFATLRELFYALIEATAGVAFKQAIETFFGIVQSIIGPLANLTGYVVGIVVSYLTAALGPIAEQLTKLQIIVDGIQNTVNFLKRLIRRFTLDGNVHEQITKHLRRGFNARLAWATSSSSVSSGSSDSSDGQTTPFADWITDEEAEPVAIEYGVPLLVAKNLIPFIEMSAKTLHADAPLSDTCRMLLMSGTGLAPEIVSHIADGDDVTPTDMATEEHWFCAVQYIRSRSLIPYKTFFSWPEAHIYLGQTWLANDHPCKQVIERDVLLHMTDSTVPRTAVQNTTEYDDWIVNTLAPCVDRYIDAFPPGGRFDFVWPHGKQPMYVDDMRAPVEYKKHVVIPPESSNRASALLLSVRRTLPLAANSLHTALTESELGQVWYAPASPAEQEQAVAHQHGGLSHEDMRGSEAADHVYCPLRDADAHVNNPSHDEYWRGTRRTRCHIDHFLESVGWKQGAAFGLAAGHGLSHLQHVINPEHTHKLHACLSRHASANATTADPAPSTANANAHADVVSRTAVVAAPHAEANHTVLWRTSDSRGRSMLALGARRFDWNPPIRKVASLLLDLVKGSLQAAYFLFNRLSLSFLAQGIELFLDELDDFDYVDVITRLVAYLGNDLVTNLWDELSCNAPKYYDARSHPNRPWTRFCLLRLKLPPVGVVYRFPDNYEDTVVPYGIPCKGTVGTCQYNAPLLGSVFRTLRFPSATSIFASLVPTPISTPCSEYVHTSLIGFVDHWDSLIYIAEDQSMAAGFNVVQELRTGTTGAAVLFAGKVFSYIAWLPLYALDMNSYAEHVIASDALKDVRYVGEVLFRFENNGVFPRSQFHSAAVGMNVWLVMGPLVFTIAFAVFAIVYTAFVFKAAFDMLPSVISLVQPPVWLLGLRGRLAAAAFGMAIPVNVASLPASATSVASIADFVKTNMVVAQTGAGVGLRMGASATENFTTDLRVDTDATDTVEFWLRENAQPTSASSIVHRKGNGYGRADPSPHGQASIYSEDKTR